MRVVVAGSREGVSYKDVARAIKDSGWADLIVVVISGGARGADKHGEAWADRHYREVHRFPVHEDDWRMFGKRAGPMRNRRMAVAADAVIVVQANASRGSANMIFEARKLGLPTHVVTL